MEEKTLRVRLPKTKFDAYAAAAKAAGKTLSAWIREAAEAKFRRPAQ
jgi:predicted HicB family RNase H-like nuclease